MSRIINNQLSHICHSTNSITYYVCPNHIMNTPQDGNCTWCVYTIVLNHNSSVKLLYPSEHISTIILTYIKMHNIVEYFLKAVL